MKKPFIRQIVQATLYYVIGCFITWFVYVLSGTPYPHGLNAFHLVGLFVIAGGFVWTIKAVGSTLTGTNEFGILLVHAIVLGSITVSFFYEINKESNDSLLQQKETFGIITKDTLNNSFSAVNENNETLYLKRFDFVFVNKLNQE